MEAIEPSTSFVEVWVASAVDALDRPFHYALPPELKGRVLPGMRVEVPFGRRRSQAFVIRLLTEPEFSPVKEIYHVLDKAPLLTEELLHLSKWVGDYYLCSRAAVLQAMLPFPSRRAKKGQHAFLALPPEKAREALDSLVKKAPRQARALMLLLERGSLSVKELKAETGADTGVIRALEGKGLATLKEGEERGFRGPAGTGERVTLTLEQEKALKALEKALDRRERETFLLHGVTGSGKTEIYLRICQKSLTAGRGSLVLVPEISLTGQMIERFQSFFGSRAALLHSKLSPGERYDEWCRLLSGKARIAVGPRSAVFAPVRDLGVIILDEEHEWTYKQEETPRYHAREVARERARGQGSLVVLGSATPSLESYYRAQRGGYKLLRLSRRVLERPMPPVSVVDMRQELKEGNRRMFSRSLLKHLQETVEAGEKALLFLNRRGHSTCVLCRECGLVIRCPHCEIAMTYHSQDIKLLCHYCSKGIRVPDTCPKCGSRYIKYFGTGTQKVEEEIRSCFPQTGIWRMDTDTTSRKGAHSKILQSFTGKGAAILIGTQMVAKGLDIPGITLVGVLAADMGLNLPDFRAGERTFQLLTQVAGRTGRGAEVGRVIVQTYEPEHYAIQAAREHDYETFYAQESRSRQELGYPPYSSFIRLLLTGEEESRVALASSHLARMAPRWRGVEFLGPVKCPLARVAAASRWHLVLKGKDRRLLRACAREITAAVRKNHANVTIVPDVDPLNML